MRIIVRIIFFFILFTAGTGLFAQSPAPKPYLGQTPPGAVPAVFAPGIISVPRRFTHDFSITRDGRECYFTVRNASWTDYSIMTMRFEEGEWTKPVRASFSNNHSVNPSLADDERTMYFSRDQHIWKAVRDGEGWAKPKKLSGAVNSPRPEYSLTFSGPDRVWICSHRPGGAGGCDLWTLRTADGTFAEPVNLLSLNTAANDCTPVTDPSESWLLWASDRPGGRGKMDIYVSYADGKGGWKAPVNLGPVFNTAANESGLSLSPDGRYLFFSRDKADGSDIYWVSTKALPGDGVK